MKVEVNKSKVTIDFEPITLTLVIQTESELVDLFNRVSAAPELWTGNSRHKNTRVNDYDTQVLYDILSEYITQRKLNIEEVGLVDSTDPQDYM